MGKLAGEFVRNQIKEKGKEIRIQDILILIENLPGIYMKITVE